MENGKKYLTVGETAQYLNCSTITVYRLVHRDGFPVTRIGRKILVSVDGLKKWLMKNSEGGFDE